MNNRLGREIRSEKLARLKSTDRAAPSHLDELRQAGGGDICTASIPTIADACNVSLRQVQISTGRLVKAGLLRRIGYDFGNVVRSHRGTKYKLLMPYAGLNSGIQFEKLKRAIQVLIKRHSGIELSLEELRLKQDKLLSLVANMSGPRKSRKYSKCPSMRR